VQKQLFFGGASRNLLLLHVIVSGNEQSTKKVWKLISQGAAVLLLRIALSGYPRPVTFSYFPWTRWWQFNFQFSAGSKVTIVLRFAHCSVFCFLVRISDLELYENILWETIAIVDNCGVRKSERNIKKNCHATFLTDFSRKSNGFYQLVLFTCDSKMVAKNLPCLDHALKKKKSEIYVRKYIPYSMPTAICNVESTRSLDHGSYAALSTVSTWMGTATNGWTIQRTGWLCCWPGVSHREELIQCLTYREGRVRHWFPQDGSGSPDQSSGVELCDHSISPVDWDKPRSLYTKGVFLVNKGHVSSKSYHSLRRALFAIPILSHT
jgi:hypothetical protein